MVSHPGYQRSRYEFKYLIDEACARQVKDFARSYLQRDRHAIPAMRYSYPIFSVYLDSPGLTLYTATMQAQMNRFKLRVRYYDHNPAHPVFCEIKKRVNDVIKKERAIIKREALDDLLKGRSPSADDLFNPRDTDSHSALRHFCELRNDLHAEPRIIVYYEREAWISPHDDNTRVTFDRAAASARYVGGLRPEKMDDAKVPGVILELKFDDRFPLWMRELVRTCDLYRTRMAKYVHCMQRQQLRPMAKPFGWVTAS